LQGLWLTLGAPLIADVKQHELLFLIWSDGWLLPLLSCDLQACQTGLGNCISPFVALA